MSFLLLLETRICVLKKLTMLLLQKIQIKVKLQLTWFREYIPVFYFLLLYKITKNGILKYNTSYTVTPHKNSSIIFYLV